MARSRKSPPPPLSDQDAVQQLEVEFSRLDSALIATIYYDTQSIEAARETLNILSSQTTIEDNADAETDTSSPLPDHSMANSCPEWEDWRSDAETDPTTTMSMASLRIDEDDGFGEDEELSDEMRTLHAMFPTMSKYTLNRTLEKCGGDYTRTTDELLNQAFLEEDGVEGKGVDGFCEEVNGFRSGRKRKKQKGRTLITPQRRMSLPPEGTENVPSAPRVSVWDKKNEEIQYLSETLGLPKGVVASKHHSTGGSLPRTVAALLDIYGGEATGDKEEHIAELDELLQEFENDVKTQHLERLLRLCKDNKAAVFNLAELLRRSLPKDGIFQINTTSISPTSPRKPTHAILHRPQDHEENWTVVGTPIRPAPVPPTYHHRPLDYTAASQVSQNFRQARNEAFQKAAASYRRSRSDKLMGGAAAFYADMGHDYNIKTKEYDDIAAERYVSENSGKDVLDLHGVTVAQALKIAKERTTQWWAETPPDERGRGMKPFRIVTGLGRHSKGGEAKLAPAVTKMLQREKWDIRVGSGEILVYGVKK
ncbi:hypothetical protein K440DRAFT_636791 [Wilcoxina mikolae CBS 423.85]|nr:hypothetical protein K440DRAFT_636791 [Wilcoxina mikolae CBS 423.85]